MKKTTLQHTNTWHNIAESTPANSMPAYDYEAHYNLTSEGWDG